MANKKILLKTIISLEENWSNKKITPGVNIPSLETPSLGSNNSQKFLICQKYYVKLI